jgi:hypothetical protein
MENITDYLVLLVTLSGFYLAYFQWFKSSRERKNHLLKLLKVQLNCLGPWVDSEGEGYGKELTEKEKFENANPFKLIYQTEHTPLINSTQLEQMSGVPEDILGEISQLIYDFKRIERIQEYKNLLTSTNLNLSLNVKEKLKDAECKHLTYIDFLKLLSNREKQFVLTLVRYGEILHCNVIGNKERSARKHWELSIKWVLNELLVYKKPQWIFIILTFLSNMLLLLATNLHFKFNLNIVIILFISTGLTFWAAIISKAIILNNEPR